LNLSQSFERPDQPQVSAIQREEVEGVEEDMLTRRLAPQPFEHREPVLIAGNRLAIDQAGTHLEPVNGLVMLPTKFELVINLKTARRRSG
jgi:hypothetical protein